MNLGRSLNRCLQFSSIFPRLLDWENPLSKGGRRRFGKDLGFLGRGRGGGCKIQTDVFRGHTKADPLETF